MSLLNGHAKPIDEIREEIDRLKAERELAELQIQQQHLAHQSTALTESWGGLYDWASSPDAWMRARLGGQQDNGRFLPPASPWDRAHGNEWPFWRTELERNLTLQNSRVCARTNSYAMGLIDNLINYLLGKGGSYKAFSKELNKPPPEEDDEDQEQTGQQPVTESFSGLDKHGHQVKRGASATGVHKLGQPLGVSGQPKPPGPKEQAHKRRQKAIKRLVEVYQDFVDAFLKKNRWNAIAPDNATVITESCERETVRRHFVDGEVFIWFHEERDGVADVTFIDPTQIRNPPGATSQDGWSHGIQHQMQPFESVEKVTAYCVYWKDPTTSAEAWDTIPAAEVIHMRGPRTPSDVTRGLPLLSYDIRASLERASRLQEYLSIGSRVRAAIADIWKHTASATQVSSLAQGTPGSRQVTNAYTGQTDTIEATRPGTRLRVPAGQEPVNPPSATGTSEHMSVLDGDLKQAAAGVCFPEFMVSASAENGNYSCHSEDTEILTRRGWLGYRELRHDDEVGTMHPETGLLEYQRPTKLHVYPHEGPMIHASGGHGLDLLVTGNHRLWVTRKIAATVVLISGEKKRFRSGELRPWAFMEAHELLESMSPWIVPFSVAGFAGDESATFTLPGLDYKVTWRNAHIRADRELAMGPWLKFLGYWISEGWVTKKPKRQDYVIGLSQRPGETADAIRSTLSELPSIHFKEYLGKNGMIHWMVRDKGLWTWLSEHGGVGAYGKKIPQFVFGLSGRLSRPLLEAMVDGDGRRRESGAMTYYTVSRQLADDVCRLGVQVGLVSSVRPPLANGVIPISLRPLIQRLTIRPDQVTVEQYKGFVWCVSVPNQLVVTRRNGRVIVTGNSLETATGPVVRAGEANQEFFRSAFAAVLGKASHMAVDAGRLPKECLTICEIQVELPAVLHRNSLEKAQEDDLKVKGRRKSPQTCMMEDGLDVENEMHNIKEWDEKMAPPGGAGGAPGAGGPPGSEIPPQPDEMVDLSGSAPVAESLRESAEWDGNKHPRGQPGNAGQFGTGGTKKPEADTSHEIQLEELFSRSRDVAAAVVKAGTAALDKVPGAKFIRDKAAELQAKLEARYGAKTAKTIAATAMSLSWASTGAAAFGVGVPIPSALLAAPMVALAELVHRLRGQNVRESLAEMGLTESQIARLMEVMG